MPRKRRFEELGGIYHVTSKGNDGQVIYRDRRDFIFFVTTLERAARKYRWVVYAYCLMTNHYHLVVKIPFGGLSAGMKLLNGGYSLQTNARYGRTGHLFRNRFYGGLIETDSHLLETSRYVVLNPVRAGLCASPAGWRWSSYRSCAGLDLAPGFLAASELLGLFGSRPDGAMRAYRIFVSEGHVRCQTPSQK